MGRRGSALESAPVVGRTRASSYWLIVKNTASEMEVLTLEVDGSPRTLPLFGSWDTATRMLPPSGGWRARETGGGELISILCGPCRDATGVVLDPSPELVEAGMAGLVTQSADGFLDALLGRGRAWFRDSPGGRVR